MGSVFGGGLGFEEEDFGAFDPALVEVNAEPAVSVLFVDAAAAAGAEFFEAVLGPGFAHFPSNSLILDKSSGWGKPQVPGTKASSIT